VNLLGIGLHSYGFTGGVMRGLTIFYLVEASVLSTGFVAFALGRSSPTPPAARAPRAPA
jgi:hypothetical protein